MRRTGGVRSEQVLRNPEDPNDVVLLFEFDDLAQARRFVESQEVRDAQQRGGVVEVTRYFPEG